ncbi:MAG: DUF2490 domain-containing protein [Cytophagaceae bacterium]
MKKYISKALILLFLIISNVAMAQHPNAIRDYNPNHMFWFQGVINGKFKKDSKWGFQMDIEYRRQADPQHAYDPGTTVGTDRFNIFKHPYQYALRPFIHYQPNENIRFSWSPITWFGTYSFPINGKVTYQPEYRTSPQITLYQKFGKVQIQHRFRDEFRFYGVKTNTDNVGDPTGPAGSYNFYNTNHQNRFRYLVRAIIPLNKPKLEKGTWYIMTSSELFVKFGKYIANGNIFDQNRFYFNLGYKFHPEIRAEIGYLNQTALRLNNKAKNNVDLNNNLFVTIIFDNINNLFSKKDDAQ